MKELKNIISKTDPFSINKLEEYFDEELHDEDFKKIVETLNIDKRILIKYTSLIKDSAKELKNCKNCKNLMECKNCVFGHIYYPKIEQNNIVFSYIPCEYKKIIDKENAHFCNVSLINMPKQILNASMKDIYTDDNNRLEAIKSITTFIKQYESGQKCKGIYLNGNFGCGKTYLIAACFNEIAKKGKNVAIVYYPEFLRELKENFDNFSYLFNKVKNSDLLLLDDIGAETTSNWNRDEILGTILQYRMQEELPTFFTSNLTINELESHLSIGDNEGKLKARRIIERIKYLTKDVIMIAENRRK